MEKHNSIREGEISASLYDKRARESRSNEFLEVIGITFFGVLGIAAFAFTMVAYGIW